MNQQQDSENNEQPLAPDDIIRSIYDVTKNIDPQILDGKGSDEVVNAYEDLEHDALAFITAMRKFDGAATITEGIRVEFQRASEAENFESLKLHIFMLMRMADEHSGTILIPVIYGWRGRDGTLKSPHGYSPLETSELAVIKPIFLGICDQLDISVPSLKNSHAIDVAMNHWMSIFIEYPVAQIAKALKIPDSVESTRLAMMLDRAARLEKMMIEARQNPPDTYRYFSITAGTLRRIISASITGAFAYPIFQEMGWWLLLIFPLFLFVFWGVDEHLEEWWPSSRDK